MKEEIQKYIIELFSTLKQKLPGNHNLQLGEDGRLWLWIVLGNKWQSIIFDEDYKDINPSALIDDILKTLIEAGYKI